jgi:hypothetical protein
MEKIFDETVGKHRTIKFKLTEEEIAKAEEQKAKRNAQKRTRQNAR